MAKEHRDWVSVESPLGGDKLLFQRLQGTEELGRLFDFQVDLLSKDENLKFDSVVGQHLSAGLDLSSGDQPGGRGAGQRRPAGGDRDGGQRRYFSGIVTQFCQVGRLGTYTQYRATLRPWFWLLTRTADCRIFQEMKVPDIIKKIFREYGFSDFRESLSGNYRKWEYCVQYRETDFEFISRLMEQEGIYYYFQHEKGKHTLVLSDSYSAHQKIRGYEKVPYYTKSDNVIGEDSIWEFVTSTQVRTGTVSLTDFDFQKPKANLAVKSTIKRRHSRADYEIYDYPGEYEETAAGDAYARARIEERQVQQETVTGQGDPRGFVPGGLFELTRHRRKDQNREYLIVSARYEVKSNEYESVPSPGTGVEFDCQFSAISGKQPFRSARTTPKPIIAGPQTAIVVGPQGEEIYTDQYGRVKVQFHWDREGKRDENSSCWIRVAQNWAGNKWGIAFHPRIGQEVIVEFLEGDPDRPIITGRVYNADQMPPYALPANQTQSTIKTRSSKGGNEQTFNEIRFEDKKGEEEIYVHAEKDHNRVVENNDTLKVGFDDKDKGDQTIEIYHDRSTTLETGSDTLIIKKGDRTVKIESGKVLEEAKKSITLKVGGSSIKIEPDKITLKSKLIKLN